ncbi:hypothetical protein [Moheibacter sp.]|uniref:hypothetical protein n=1 Tax=Moheibacter sp. TaxID=1965316 RepID=UPI003C754262
MNKKLIWILLYVVIVGLSVYITYNRFVILRNPEGETIMNYVLFGLFIVFTLINLRILIKRIKEC